MASWIVWVWNSVGSIRWSFFITFINSPLHWSYTRNSEISRFLMLQFGDEKTFSSFLSSSDPRSRLSILRVLSDFLEDMQSKREKRPSFSKLFLLKSSETKVPQALIPWEIFCIPMSDRAQPFIEKCYRFVLFSKRSKKAWCELAGMFVLISSKKRRSRLWSNPSQIWLSLSEWALQFTIWISSMEQ